MLSATEQTVVRSSFEILFHFCLTFQSKVERDLTGSPVLGWKLCNIYFDCVFEYYKCTLETELIYKYKTIQQMTASTAMITSKPIYIPINIDNNGF